MANPWTYAGKVAARGAGATVTLVEESTFTISETSGDIVQGAAQGLFFRDSRVLSRLELRVNGKALEPLSVVTPDPFSATFVARTDPAGGQADSSILVFRTRYVGQGMLEEFTLHNFGSEPTAVTIEFFIDADFADLFAVKEGRGPDDDGLITRSSRADSMSVNYRRGALNRAITVRFVGPDAKKLTIGEDLAQLEVVVPARGQWEISLEVVASIDGVAVKPRYRAGHNVERAAPSRRLAEWRESVPIVHTDHDALGSVIARSAEDLGALRIFDPDFPDRVVVAAGAPWFMTVFGRDSLLTAWSALIVDPDLALGVLQTLGRFQGTDVNLLREEQPGRILHEMRFGEAATLSLGGGSIYYGTADATPLFVMLLGELRRWGLGREQVDTLLPNADRALDWIANFGDRDGDGYVEYQRATDRGLANQGWKDSWDGVRYADGRVATAPIALCEVQAYVYGAYLARAHFAFEHGDTATFDRYKAKAADLKVAFNRDFWVEEKGWFAIGLDADKKPIDSCTSNMGHCLWTGIVDEDKAQSVARHLMSPEMFSGWGVRTLSSAMGGYNPVSYHCGSVWPHDTAIAAAGLARYGFEESAQKLVLALLDAAVTQDGRLPELFAGLDRGTFPAPVSYPSSCSPQAWSAASALLGLRTLLRFDPWVPYSKTWIAPMIPAEIGDLRVEGIPLAGSRLNVTIEGGKVEIEGMPEGIEVIRQPRHPATSIGAPPKS